MMNLENIKEESRQAAEELCSAAKLTEGDLFVVGCSSSEVLGERIGTHTSVEAAEAVYEGIVSVLAPRGILLAGQCCEHLNRALAVEYDSLKEYRLEQVNAIPQPDHAGGAFATVCFSHMKNPVLAEDLRAQARAGIDIGGTLIGMHIRPVVVPVRLTLSKIGNARIICARSRIKYTGGIRAVYDERFL